MLQPRLLERIQALEDPDRNEQQSPAMQQVNSIISHLSRLLNTRQGSVAIAPDYGVPDMTNIPGDSILDTRERIERVIGDVVRKYEPRLKNIRLIMQSDENEKFTLKFRLEANLAEKDDVPVVFETVVSTEGRITVSQ
jgi:type VI secretion system protein